MKCSLLGILGLSLVAAVPSAAQDSLFRYQPDEQTRWISPENPAGDKGAGARENRGAKGHAFETIALGGSHALATSREPASSTGSG
jgi:hypothetical protein